MPCPSVWTRCRRKCVLLLFKSSVSMKRWKWLFRTCWTLKYQLKSSWNEHISQMELLQCRLVKNTLSLRSARVVSHRLFVSTGFEVAKDFRHWK
jgi:hypothetical protein